MSAEDADDEPSVPEKVLRTVTPGVTGKRNIEMDALGWGILVGMLILLVPLLPFIIIVWLLTKVFDFVARARGE
ncbi:hypothetical protein ACFQL3_16210 [Natronoarchaeum sp. GCM10025321]|uniref:DUF7535 family protein n=1 Tax=Natronoarchaeum sp. GCM10025321 TaxID=3252684 RepID=UPI003607F858